MGIAMALMAYSKYHGALVVLFALAANPRQLLRPALYSSGAVALLLLVPHLVWQYEHDWASFAYHLSGRNSVFRPATSSNSWPTCWWSSILSSCRFTCRHGGR